MVPLCIGITMQILPQKNLSVVVLMSFSTLALVGNAIRMFCLSGSLVVGGYKYFTVDRYLAIFTLSAKMGGPCEEETRI